MEDSIDLVGQLRGTLGKMELALGAISDAIIWTDERASVQWCNSPCDALLGRQHLEILGKRLTELLPLKQNGQPLSPDRHPVHLILDTRLPVDARYEFERDGRRLILEVSGGCAQMGGYGQSAVLVLRDVTDRERMEKELVQAEKLAAIGRFSSGIAHEVKNPLGVILGGIEFLETRLRPGDSEAKTALQLMKGSTLRADAVVRSLLQFAKPSSLRKERVECQELLGGTLELLARQFSLSNITVEVQPVPEALWVNVDKNQIQQALFNLLLNAKEAMPHGGAIRIRTFKGAAPGHSPSASCLMEISDTGEGISPENFSRLFEPFFTTKRDRKGTGLGLSITKRILEDHQGDLSIMSEPRKGTTVRIALPLAEGGSRNEDHSHDR